MLNGGKWGKQRRILIICILGASISVFIIVNLYSFFTMFYMRMIQVENNFTLILINA